MKAIEAKVGHAVGPSPSAPSLRPHLPHGGLGWPGQPCGTFGRNRCQQLRSTARAACQGGATSTRKAGAIFRARRQIPNPAAPSGACAEPGSGSSRPEVTWRGTDSRPIRGSEGRGQGRKRPRMRQSAGSPTLSEDGGARVQLFPDHFQVSVGRPVRCAAPLARSQRSVVVLALVSAPAALLVKHPAGGGSESGALQSHWLGPGTGSGGARGARVGGSGDPGSVISDRFEAAR